MLDELLQKTINLYVPPAHRPAALVTFRQLLEGAKVAGANEAISALTAAMRGGK